ncbi:hypothetical protein FNAPI_3061 [Fusarium napiforme]|uniref:Uncharacterized protein n=1 Tax=Fusarium napiforme TaxID=42672 RepID=A0A8H5JXU8_9HYPO|nr:hypothetical protein FNAPI_3061 [Fusarium napiforme]
MMQVFPSTVLVPGDSAAPKILSLQRRAFFESSRISASLIPVSVDEQHPIIRHRKLGRRRIAGIVSEVGKETRCAADSFGAAYRYGRFADDRNGRTDATGGTEYCSKVE